MLLRVSECFKNAFYLWVVTRKGLKSFAAGGAGGPGGKGGDGGDGGDLSCPKLSFIRNLYTKRPANILFHMFLLCLENTTQFLRIHQFFSASAKNLFTASETLMLTFTMNALQDSLDKSICQMFKKETQQLFLFSKEHYSSFTANMVYNDRTEERFSIRAYLQKQMMEESSRVRQHLSHLPDTRNSSTTRPADDCGIICCVCRGLSTWLKRSRSISHPTLNSCRQAWSERRNGFSASQRLKPTRDVISHLITP